MFSVISSELAGDTVEKRHQQIEKELDRIVRAELNSRVSGRKKQQRIDKINRIIETRNRQIVEAHQRGRTETILTAMLLAHLQLQEGGALFLSPDGHGEAAYESYRNRRERFDTLFAAAVMALEDKVMAEIMMEKRALFATHHQQLKSLMQLTDTAYRIRKEAEMAENLTTGVEDVAIYHLRELAPLKSDIETIEARTIEVRDNVYLQDAVQKLQQAIQAAKGSIAEKRRRAARFLFDKAGDIFQRYKATPADFNSVDIFIEQKESLARYADIFDTISDPDRRDRIRGFIATIDTTLTHLQRDLEKQKSREVEISEKHQQVVNDTYERFQEIRDMYARGEMNTPGQQKNVAERLKKFRDTFKANGQRVMAQEVDRFMNATGIGSPPEQAEGEKAQEDQSFDYRKGFLILLPITLGLFFLLMLMVLL